MMQEANDPERIDIGEIFGEVSRKFLDNEAKFLSLSDFSLNFGNYFMWKLHMGAIFSDEESINRFPAVQLARLSRKFRDIFSETPVVKNFEIFTCSEKSRMLLFQANQKLFRWISWLLVTPEIPLTVNSIIFILEISNSLTQADGVSAEMAAMIISLGRGGTITRRDIFQLIAAKHFAEWLPTFWSGKVKVELDKSPELANKPIPLTWCLRESNATEWLSSFETLKLWAKGDMEIYYIQIINLLDPKGDPIPIVWPSLLREWFWRLKRAGSPTLPLSLEVVSISKNWMPFRKPKNDRRVKAMIHFLLPSPESLTVPDGDVNLASRVNFKNF